VKLELELQWATEIESLPTTEDFERWTKQALQGRREEAELTIRLVDEEESQQLNREYRDKDRPTNVLSFPADLPAVVESPLLGDLVICAPVVLREAREQNKTAEAHWAHMVVHGVLHLLGYDHQNESEATEMERTEAALLGEMGFDNPYRYKPGQQ
jgi:probable rRNA maturation factor